MSTSNGDGQAPPRPASTRPESASTQPGEARGSFLDYDVTEHLGEWGENYPTWREEEDYYSSPARKLAAFLVAFGYGLLVGGAMVWVTLRITL